MHCSDVLLLYPDCGCCYVRGVTTDCATLSLCCTLRICVFQTDLWESLSQLCEWLRLVRALAAEGEPVSAISGGGSLDAASSAVAATVVSRLLVDTPSLATLLSSAVLSAEPAVDVVCDQLCARLVLAVRTLQVECAKRVVAHSSSALHPALSSPAAWCSLLTDLHPLQARLAGRGELAHSALMQQRVQQIIALAVRSAMLAPTTESSTALSHFLFHSLLPALQSAMSTCSDSLPPSTRTSADTATVSSVLRDVRRFTVYRLLVSACVSCADCCVDTGRAAPLPPAAQSLWRFVLSIVDESHASAASSVSSASSGLPKSATVDPLAGPYYNVGRLSLVRCLLSSPIASSQFMPLLSAADTRPTPTALLSSHLSTAFDLLLDLPAATSSHSPSTSATTDTARLRTQCGEFILFALTAPAFSRRQHQQPGQQSSASTQPALPPPRSLTTRLIQAMAAAGGDTDVADLIRRAFIELVSPHSHTDTPTRRS